MTITNKHYYCIVFCFKAIAKGLSNHIGNNKFHNHNGELKTDFTVV